MKHIEIIRLIILGFVTVWCLSIGPTIDPFIGNITTAVRETGKNSVFYEVYTDKKLLVKVCHYAPEPFRKAQETDCWATKINGNSARIWGHILLMQLPDSIKTNPFKDR